jgi:hypothetical protein
MHCIATQPPHRKASCSAITPRLQPVPSISETIDWKVPVFVRFCARPVTCSMKSTSRQNAPFSPSPTTAPALAKAKGTQRMPAPTAAFARFATLPKKVPVPPSP